MARHHGRCPWAGVVSEPSRMATGKAPPSLPPCARTASAPFLIEGPLDGEVFTAYLEHVFVRNCAWATRSSSTTSHSRDPRSALISAHELGVHYLPAYSPDLNPIELAFASSNRICTTAARTLEELHCALAEALNSFSLHTAKASFVTPNMRLCKSKML